MKKDKKLKKEKPKPEPIEEEVELDPEVLDQEHIIKPSDTGSSIHSQKWPFLLKNY
jgi:hypothetical protein